MEDDSYKYLVLIAALFLLGYLLNTMIGYDSYYFLNIVFGKMISGESAFFTWFFTLLPRDINTLKIILILPFLASMIIVAKTGECIFGKRGWLAGVLLIFNGVFIFESLKFEDEQFIYPLLFLALYCFVWLLKKKKYYSAFLVPAGVCFLAYTLWISQGVGIPFMASPEYVPFANAIPMIFGLIGMAGYVKDKRLITLALPATILTIVALLIPKLAMFAAPFLALGLYAVIEKFEDMGKIDVRIILALGVAIALFSTAFISIQRPQAHEFDAVKYAILSSKALDKPIINDWTYGYLIIWQGGLTKNYGGGTIVTDYNNSIALTQENLNCNLLQSFQEVNVYNCGGHDPSPQDQ